MTPRINRGLTWAAFAMVSWSGAPSRAGIVGTTGQVDVISPPTSVALGGLASNTNAFLFEERNTYTLPSSVGVDMTASGSVSSYGNLVMGTIGTGTLVDDYMMHTEAVDPNQDYTGSITFSTAILGVIVLDASLDATDGVLGSSDTTYATGLFGRGLELNPIADTFSISSDHLTLNFSLTTGAVMDEIRILTVGTVPEPFSVILVGLGGACSLGLAKARRKHFARHL